MRKKYAQSCKARKQRNNTASDLPWIKRKCQSRMGNQSAECGKWEILTFATLFASCPLTPKSLILTSP